MRVFSVKLGRAKLIIIFLAAAAVIALTAVLLFGTEGDTAGCEAGEYSVSLDGESALPEFLEQFGLEAEADSIIEENILVPSEFNSVFEKYNELQQKIGLDLSRYKGREAVKYTVKINNGGADYAVVLACGGRVIGAHLTNGVYGGENLPLV